MKLLYKVILFVIGSFVLYVFGMNGSVALSLAILISYIEFKSEKEDKRQVHYNRNI